MRYVLAFASAVALVCLPADAQAQIFDITEAQTLADGSIAQYGVALWGYPVELGIVMTKGALNGDTGSDVPHSDGLSDVVTDGGEILWMCCGYEHEFEMPSNFASSAFKHTVVNWNPHGHPPPAVYTVPHFDFHFYTIDHDTRWAITPPNALFFWDPDNDASTPDIPVPLTSDQFFNHAMVTPPADQQPPGLTNVGAVEPRMGNHLINLGAAEFQTENGFTQTWITGIWDGDITFWEPMITVAFFQTNPNACYPVPFPDAAPEAGWYPTRYCIRTIGNVHTISLNRWRWRPQSTGI